MARKAEQTRFFKGKDGALFKGGDIVPVEAAEEISEGEYLDLQAGIAHPVEAVDPPPDESPMSLSAAAALFKGPSQFRKDAMFTPDQVIRLKEPLSTAHVKQRSQGKTKLSYVEGWKMIETANDIFGFGNWDRRTTMVKMVNEEETTLGQDKHKGWTVSYIAQVEITVRDPDVNQVVVRHGIGSGHGKDRDVGLAHESAIKEAETDAMKRALMTFGYPFGLALYDKDKEQVKSPEEIYINTAVQAAQMSKTLAEFGTWFVAERKNRERLGLTDPSKDADLFNPLRDIYVKLSKVEIDRCQTQRELKGWRAQQDDILHDLDILKGTPEAQEIWLNYKTAMNNLEEPQKQLAAADDDFPGDR